MGQFIPGGWTAEQSDALKALVFAGKSYAQAAALINADFGTSYSRNSAIGRANRIGLQVPKRDKKPPKARTYKPRTTTTQHTITRIVRTNSNSNAMRVVESVGMEYKLRCVEIVPRNVTLLDLEKNDCRYPYGDGPIVFCGHPKQDGSSYCTPHFHLCRQEPRQPKQPYFVRGAAA